MNECVKNNILNIEIYTDGGCPAKYTITIFNACNENVAGASVCGSGKEFLLPDGEYKIEVKGDAFASPRMQQRWITICGQGPECHFGMNFIFGRLSTYNKPDNNTQCNQRPGKLPCPPPCPGNKPHHPCAPVCSPFQPSMYVKEWEKRNNIEYNNCSHSYTHSAHNDIAAECGKYKPVPPAPKPPECKPAPKSNRGRRPSGNSAHK